MNSVIIFDVNPVTKTKDVIRGMNAIGYFKNWTNENKVVNLPHNIVWKPNTEYQKALDDLKSVIANINQTTPCVLHRCVILNSTPWMAVWGEPIQ